MPAAIEIKNLDKVYSSGTRALKKLNFKVEKGEFFALLGPNGSGKTTLINIMSGPVKKTSGQVKIGGLNIEDHREKTKFMIGVVPQELSFDSFFTVNEVLELQSGYYGIRENQKHIDNILEKLNLTDKKNTRTRFLSGGMKRRLMIAKALVHKPEIIVLDEPTAGVDVELRHNLWDYMKELNKEGLTILLTTHYLEEAEQLCSRTAIIHEGKLVALDKTKKLISSMGNAKKMTLIFDKKITKIPAGLKKYKTELKNKELNIYFESKKLSDILKSIDGLKPIDIEVEGQKLEDVFLELTYKNHG